MPQRQFTGDPSLDAIILRELRYSQTRWAEVWLALIMTGFGMILLYPLPTFVGPQWRFIAAFVTEGMAGSIALTVGSIRLIALFVNGRRRETPLARLLGCQGGFLFWAALTVGFALAVPPLSSALAVYPVLMIAELHSAWRCGGDIIAADSLRFRDRLRRREAAEREAEGNG